MKKVFIYIGRIILLSYFSLLFNGELYAHGAIGLIIPQLIAIYIVYMIFIDFLRKKFDLDDLQIFLTGSVIGLLIETFYTKSIFQYPIIFGVNWLSVIVQSLYWGMAALLPFYIYNLLFAKKSKLKNNKLLNIGIIIYLALEFVLGSLRIAPTPIWIITGVPLGILTLLTINKKKLI